MHPQFDPVALALGPVAIRWYGLMYLIGFALFWGLGKLRSRDAWRDVSATDVEDLLFYGILGVILGGRLGFCLFYQPAWFLTHPLDMFKVWQGGMSAHGGMIGAILAIFYFAYTHKKSVLAIGDFVAPLAPLGLFFGRIGNFINGELWGRVTDSTLPWMMVFPQSGSALARHPSQLYEALLEGLFLFLFLWCYSAQKRATGRVAAFFCVGYAIARFTVEFFREPDSYLGFGLWGLTRGQWLTVPVLLLGLILYVISTKKR